MSYQALYRKYRPKDFDSVKGQDHIITTLANQIKSDRVGHAYLFCGTRGTGKTTVAKIFAKAVNCENPGPKGPCGVCPMCQAIENQTSMNVVEIDAASNNKVDDIRQVIDEVQYSPAEGRYKVYIIDEVHMLSTSAFNALLKTLEEPPSYMIFILATTEAYKIPLTILSRCQRYDFKRIDVSTISGRLRELLDKEGVQAEDNALDYIARQADGALRDGLSLLEQCISFYFGETLTYEKVLNVLGAVDQEIYHELLEGLLHSSVDQILLVVKTMVEQGKDLTRFVNEFVWYLRNLLVVKTASSSENLVDMSEENRKELERFADEMDMNTLFRCIRIMSELANDMKYHNDKRVLLEVTLVKMCRPQMEQDYESIIQRLNQLEQLNEDLQVAMETGQFAVAANPQPSGGGEAPAPKKEIRPEAIPDDVKSVVASWKQVLARLNPVIRSMLAEVRVSVSEAGRLILAFSKQTEAQYFQREQIQSELTEVMGQLTGKEVGLDIRLAETRQEINALPELRNIIKNVEIEYMED